MTPNISDVDLRRWLVDYLITNIGCEANQIDLNASFADLGIGSRDAVVLSGELADLVGRAVSPVEMWQHPTVNSLVEYLTTPESEIQSGTEVSAPDRVVTDEPVAVIGVGCRFPGDISGPEAYWEFLGAGRSAVGEVPAERWASFGSTSPEAAAALSDTTRWGSFLSDVDAFDADFFEISPREAAKIDPQQRLLLEVAYEALEHAGIRADSLRHSQTGIFVGACAGEYGYLASADLSQVDAWSGTGGALSIIANRISYFLDLRGPSVTVDTACSSALVAVHLACQSLRAGESNIAIAGGVNLLLSPVITRSFDHAEAMSPTGQCHVFDSAADGFVRGEGCGAVVLKRLGDALRDGDRVLAVVRGSAVNQDGRSNGLMAPNPAAQMAVLRAAYANAGVEPRQVHFVEANATGTLLGDPIEARALGTVLGRGRPKDAPLLIGSVKSNLGHLDAAAGIAGLIKAVLAVERGHIPANLNFHTPNPHVPFDELGLKVVDQPVDWPETASLRRAGVSSFGFGGTNAHVVVEQRPDPVPVSSPGPEAGAVTTLVVSGKTVERVASTAAMLAQWMDGPGAQVGLAEVAHTVNHHRARHGKFATVAAVDREQAVAGLWALAQGRSADGVVAPHRGECRPGTVFVYSGQGSQWAGMGRQLLADEAAFAAAVAELEPIFVEEAGFSLQEVLTAGEPVLRPDRVEPVLLAVQLALTKLWRSFSVVPDAVIGHSMGEVTAAVVAGALTPRDGLRVIAARAQHASLTDLAPRRPRIPVITGAGAPTELGAEYWAESSAGAERFIEAVAAAGADYGTFVEISPHPILTETVSDTLGEVHHHSIGTLRRDSHDTLSFHTNLNSTHIARPPKTDHPPEPHSVIPTTPWHHTRHWITASKPPAQDISGWGPHWSTIQERMQAAVSAPRSGTLLGEHVSIGTTPPVHLWQAQMTPEAKPYPGSHRIQGVETLPAAVLLQTLLTAAAEYGASAMSDVRFEHPLAPDRQRLIQVVADGESVTVASGSTREAPADARIEYASARIALIPEDGAWETGDADEEAVGLASVPEPQHVPGVDGQPFAWSIESCRSGADAVRADVVFPEASMVALLDAAVHIARLADDLGPRVMVPVAAGRIRLHNSGFADPRAVVEVRRRSGNNDEMVVDIVVRAADGDKRVDIRSLRYVTIGAQVPSADESASVVWSQIPPENRVGELRSRLQAIVAHELGMSASAVEVDRAFPELGLDSTMAMAVLRGTNRLVGFEVSATMLWDHPSIASLAGYLAELLAVSDVSEGGSDEDVEPESGSAGSVLDELFDSVESV